MYRKPNLLVNIAVTLLVLVAPRPAHGTRPARLFQRAPQNQPAASARVDIRTLPIGTPLVSRNRDERQNTSPGYWNHAAVIVGPGQIVESQEGRGVIRTGFDEYLARDYSRIVALPLVNPQQGPAAADRAERLVGRPFAQFSSALPNHGKLLGSRGLSCMSVMEITFQDNSINRPDRMLKKPRLFLNPETVR